MTTEYIDEIDQDASDQVSECYLEYIMYRYLLAIHFANAYIRQIEIIKGVKYKWTEKK